MCRQEQNDKACHEKQHNNHLYKCVYLLFHYKGEIGTGFECIIELNEVNMIQLVHHSNLILHLLLLGIKEYKHFVLN